MATNDPPNLQTRLNNIPKSEDLDLIANFMDTILNNMKSHVQYIQKNKNTENSILNPDLQNVMNPIQKAIPNTPTPVKSEVPNQTKKSAVSPEHPHRTESKCRDIKNTQNKKKLNSTKSISQSAYFNPKKKNAFNNNTTKPNVIKNGQNSNMKQNSSLATYSNKPVQQNASPRKMLVVYKENDKFVSRSLTTMLKQTNKPQISTLIPIQSINRPNVTNTHRRNSNNLRNRTPSITPITNNMNTRNSNTRSRSFSRKPVNTILNPLQQTTAASSSIRSKSFSGNVFKNSRNTMKQGSVKEGIINKKPSLYVSPKSIPEKFFHISNHTLRPMSVSSERPASRNSDNNTRTISLNLKSVDQKQTRNKSPDMPKRSNPNLNKKPFLEKKAQPELKKLDEIEIHIQNAKKSTDCIQQEYAQDAKLATPISINQIITTKPVTPIKFMKNTENTKIQQINTNDNLRLCNTDQIIEKTEDAREHLSQGKSSISLNEMADNSITKINGQIQEIIDKIKEENDCNDQTIQLYTDEKCLNAENTVKNEPSNNNSKPETPTQPPIIHADVQSRQSTPIKNNRNNFNLHNSRIYINKRPQSRNNTNPQHKKPSTIIIKPPIAKRIIANSTSVIPRNSNLICIPPNRKLSVLTPMEIVQDFVNLVNKAKRDRKTFTVCGNYYSIRRAFAERGWVEKLRINLIDDKESWRKLENLSNFELVEGIKDKENGDKYRRVFISKLLAGHQVDFYWDYMTNPFSVNNDKIKRTLINRLPFGASRSYTSKAGLCESLKEAYWYYIEGYSNILFPRTYNLVYDEEVNSFVEDFRRTAVMSLLQWILKHTDKPTSIISPSGQIPTSVFNFATLQCYNLIKSKEHKDIDEIIPVAKEYEWDIYLEKYYKIVHQGNHFKETSNISAPLLIDQAKYILNKLRKYYPQIDYDGNMNLWLLKPNNGSRGCGIHVCRTLRYTLDTIHSRKETKYVIQKYLERPLLIHNTKFDIRQWFLITCMPNLHVWLYKDCYLRFSSQMYDLSKLHESIHLTNNSIQCRYRNNCNRSNDLPEQNMWHSDTFRRYLSDIGQPYAWRNTIYKGIKECFVGLFMLCQDKILTRVNSFELCGADFMLTEDYRPYLIEINSRPALYPSTRITAKMCPKVLEDVVKVTIDYARNPRASTGNFELIYKDTFNYVPPKNLNTIFIEGVNYKKYADDKTKRPILTNITNEKFLIKEIDDNSGTIEKILKIDPNKVRKDVKNTLEKILAIIHSEQNKPAGGKSSDEKNKQYRMMLSEFVNIISCVKNKSDKFQ